MVSNKLRFTFRVLSLYKKQFNFRSVLFTKSELIKQIAKSYGIDVLPEPETNEYGLPFINSMLITARDTFHFQQMIYINADIIINPGTFSLAAFFDKYFENQKVETGNQCDECVVCYGRNRHERARSSLLDEYRQL